MSEPIENQLKEMIVDRLFLKISPGDIEDEKNLMADYGVDSVSVMELAVGLEEVFGITFGEGEFNLCYFETVKAMADFVRSKQAG